MKARLRIGIFSALVLLFGIIALASLTQLTAARSSQFPDQVASTTFTSQNSTATSSATNRTGFLDTITGPIVAWVERALTPYLGQPPHMPETTLFTIVIAIGLGLMSSSAAKLLVDYDMVRNAMREGQAWRKEMEKAKKANDEQTLSKLMKKQQAMTKLQARASMEQFKVTAVTFVPFLLLWYLLSAVFGRYVVAIAPFPLPIAGDHLNFVSWYFLSSFAVNFPMMRLFGIGMSDT